ncbi:MAG: T9SS type A sorting domain-containing protein, partial [Bacteroidetes bacterium]|nr:T9SS type A sorting domain-containing protein [Bacteroidota bacterium]
VKNKWYGNTTYDFYCVNNKIFILGHQEIREIDLNTGSLTRHTHFTTDEELDLYRFLEIPNSDENMSDEVWIYGDEKFTKFSDLSSNPIRTQAVSNKDIDGMKKDYVHYDPEIPGFIDDTDYLNGAVLVQTQGDLNSSIVYIITGDKLLKVDLDKPDSLLLSVPYSTATDDKKFTQNRSTHKELVYNSQDTSLWFTTYYNNQIGQYNINTNILTAFDTTQLPVHKDFWISNYFVMPDPNTGIKNIVFFIYDDNKFKLLIYNSITKDWEIEEIGFPNNSSIYLNQPKIYSSFLWPFNNNEIAVSFKGDNVRSFCIYNRADKQWRDFEVPLDLELFHTDNGDPIPENNLQLILPKKIDWIKKNKSIGILYDYCLIEYTPASSTDDISTEEGIFQEIGIRNIYPNPITRSSTVDIMCYVQDLNKIDIGLYDVLGTKILDLNNNYEYNSTTHTITTTIEVPVGMPSGTYYLNVRNGSERRTRVVAIGK